MSNPVTYDLSYIEGLEKEIERLRAGWRDEEKEVKRLRKVLLKLIEKIENRDDMPTEEYRAALKGKP